MASPNIDALIISAGYSSRMRDFKPLMLYEGFPFIISVICKTSKICKNIYIVTGYRAEDVREEVQRWLEKQPEKKALECVNLSEDKWKNLHLKVNFIHNDSYAEGMFSSLKIGLQQIRNTDWILYHFVDQPHIPADFYTLFVRQLDTQYHWIQPRHQKKNAHPILMRKDLCYEITTVDTLTDLKSFSLNRKIKKKFWNCDYPQVLSDFNTPDKLYNQGDSNGYL
jgi:molybdenum cofactor cytidylyltransferase